MSARRIPGREAATAALLRAARRWVAALNALGAPAVTARAFAPDGRVVPHRSETGAAAPALEGIDAIAGWLASSPPASRFRTMTRTLRLASRAPIRGEVRYARTSKGHRHGGRWELTLDADGRITELHHRPDRLVETHAPR